MKIHYETKTKKKWTLIFLTRRNRDETVSFFYVQDKTKLKILGVTKMRLGVLVYFFTRPRRELPFNEEKDYIFSLILLKTTYPDQDETETRVKLKQTRQDRDETIQLSQKISFETRQVQKFCTR